MVGGEVRQHNHMALRACPVCHAAWALQTCMMETVEQCSREDENSRSACTEAGQIACGAAVSLHRTLSQWSYRAAMPANKWMVVMRKLHASKRDEYNGVTGCSGSTYCACIPFLGASQACQDAPHVWADSRNPGVHQFLAAEPRRLRKRIIIPGLFQRSGR